MSDGPEPEAADRSRAILDFWFSEQSRPLWFTRDDAFDRTIAEHFQQDYRRVADGDLSAFPPTPEGALALVILLDQFPRNMFRGDARSFATDAAARATAEGAIKAGFDTGLTGEQRQFLYMPFMHSEDLEDQKHCVRLFMTRGDSGSALDFAVRHLRIVERFGRFPHRNAVLGRESTAEERAFLEEPGSSF